jgi:hypothetical protein
MGEYLFIPKNILFFCIYQPISFFVFFENCLVSWEKYKISHCGLLDL